ncbi:MAG: PaaI family thioesterase [Dehalococcoidia bacterium]
MSKPENKADNIAELKAKVESEPIASFLNMRLVELSPGYARVSMAVRHEYQNFNGMTFGGIIMAVADQAFAYASNSLAFPSLASQFNLHFIAGAKVGDELIAECRVVKSGRRVGISEITVTNQDGKLLAKATGTTIPTSDGASPPERQ